MSNEIDIRQVIKQIYPDATESDVESLTGRINPANLSPSILKKMATFAAESEKDNQQTELHFVVPGISKPAKRPRGVVMNTGGGGARVRMYADDADDRQNFRLEIIRQLKNVQGFKPFAGACSIRFFFYRPIPQSFPVYKALLAEIGYIRPEVKPDYDNLAKLATDAMLGVVFIDDSLIVSGGVELLYSDTPRTEVFVSGRSSRMFK